MLVNLKLKLQKKDLNTGSPLGPLLFPYGIDINKVLDEIKKKFVGSETMSFNIILDLENRSFKVDVEKPEIKALIKKYSKNGTISLNDLKEIEKISGKKLKTLIGTCKSMHITVV